MKCECGLDDSPDGFRLDVVCPKHDQPAKVYTLYKNGQPEIETRISVGPDVPNGGAV